MSLLRREEAAHGGVFVIDDDSARWRPFAI
jgi:hypothetical protein